MKSFVYWLLSLVLVFGVFLSACTAPKPTAPAAPTPATGQPSPAPAPAPLALTEAQKVLAAEKEGSVDLWTMSWGAPSIQKAWAAKYPSIKFNVWDAPTRPALLARMMEEASVGRHSVDLVILTAEMPQLVQAGMLQEYEWPNTKGWPLQPTNNLYRAVGTNAYFPAYNTDLVTREGSPKSWDDVNNPKWAGKAMASTSSDRITLYFAYLWGEGGKLNWEKSESFWGQVIKNAQPVSAMSGFDRPLELMSAGEKALFVCIPFNVIVRMMWKGGPVAPGVVDKTIGANYYMAIVKNGPHPNAAKLFADFMTSSEAIVTYSEDKGFYIYDPVAALKSRANLAFAQLGTKLVALPIDIETEQNNQRASSFWMKLLGMKT